MKSTSFLLKKYDEAFKDLHEYMTQIPLFDLTYPIDPNRFEDALFIFDDCLEMSDTIDLKEIFTDEEVKSTSKAKLHKKIKEIKMVTEDIIRQSVFNLIILGRSRRLSLILRAHNLRTGNYISKQILTEITGLFVFAKSKLRGFLEIYQSHLDKKVINTIIDELFDSSSDFSYLFLNQISKS